MEPYCICDFRSSQQNVIDVHLVNDTESMLMLAVQIREYVSTYSVSPGEDVSFNDVAPIIIEVSEVGTLEFGVSCPLDTTGTYLMSEILASNCFPQRFIKRPITWY